MALALLGSGAVGAGDDRLPAPPHPESGAPWPVASPLPGAARAGAAGRQPPTVRAGGFSPASSGDLGAQLLVATDWLASLGATGGFEVVYLGSAGGGEQALTGITWADDLLVGITWADGALVGIAWADGALVGIRWEENVLLGITWADSTRAGLTWEE